MLTTVPDAATPSCSAALSPAMRQYQQFKERHPGYVLFFRMGDFYEMFWEDARIASRVLGVALTSRSRGGIGADDAIPMAGVPFHAVEGYLRRMIAAGHKVAICEQTEDASLAKGLVKRDVVRLMTPGTLTDEPLLDGRAENNLAAVAFHLTRRDGYRAALAWVELSTGSCCAMSGSESQVLDELARLRPAELLVPELPSGQVHEIAGKLGNLAGGATAAGTNSAGIAVTARPGWQFTPRHAQEEVQRQWHARSAAGFGFDDDDPAMLAVGALLSYLQETQKTGLSHVRPPRRHSIDDHLLIDPSTFRSLEIDRTVRTGKTEGSLLEAVDQTRTPMGGRLFRQWVRYPLRERDHIEARQNAVAAFLEAPEALRALIAALDDVCDIERIVGRLAVGRASPRDVAALSRCLAALPALLDGLDRMADPTAVAPELAGLRQFCQAQAEYLAGAILPDPAAHLRDGGVIAEGFDAELDRLRTIGSNSQQWLADFQQRLSRDSSIPTLKVGYNKVFGYYIEVTDSHREKIPAAWSRKQTIKNAERYITEELKQFENEAIGARDRAIAMEQQLFESIRQRLLPSLAEFQELAAAVARTDVLSSLAAVAIDRRWCRPSVVEQRVLRIIDGRHPVLERQLGASFVSNDTNFAELDSVQLITGPNMAGKSTYIRQVALIVLLAQVGSYVPAKSATIGLADRLFARIGASDELHNGQSTFMVEMIETANILNNATDRSVVVLDEIGRGTSTLDGLSLAWAIAEHAAAEVKCRTLFATHYHELTDLSQRYAGVKNFNVSVREWDDQVVFLHRIVEGGTDRSYGIHVARLAGVPRSVLERARQLLGELSVQRVGRLKISRGRKGDDDNQLPLFIDPAVELALAFKAVEVEALTPVAAFDLLRQWKQKFAL